MSLDFSLRCAV